MEWPPEGPRRRNKGWGLASYVLLTIFIASFLILGFRHALTYDSIGKRPKVDFPDFNNIISYKELPESEVNLNDINSRLIFSGDVHGMNESLHDLLTKLSWDPSHDTLFFAGDLLAKSDHSDSLAVWDFIYKNHINDQGRQVIYPVRGNHDQFVVQWRAWRDWFEELVLSSPPHRHPFQSLLPSGVISFARSLGLDIFSNHSDLSTIHTGRDFLNLIEAEWVIASSSSRPTPPDPEEYVEVARKRARGTWREPWWARIPETPKHARDQKEWRMFSDHYWLARDIEREAVDWLTNNVPLVTWLSGLHTFVVHAGVLPGDPTLDMDDRRQPLASVPGQMQEAGKVRSVGQGELAENERLYQSLHSQEPLGSDISMSSVEEYIQRNLSITALRRLQERSILTQIPQNTDPWVALNMRSVKKNGDVTRNMDKGTPWSELWADAMKHCKGFGLPEEEDFITAFADTEDSEVALDDGAEASKKYKLKCHPSTVVYGHAATRGLDIKRWSFGLDTGCVYGGRLTALVLSRKGQSGSDEDGEDGDEDEEDEEWREATLKKKKKKKKTKFGDADAHIKARLVSVECPNPDDEGEDD